MVDTNSHDSICKGVIDSPVPQLPSSPSGLRKTQSMGKMTEKKGIAARLRRLRRGQDPRTSIVEQCGMTSGESDSEAITGNDKESPMSLPMATIFHLIDMNHLLHR
jgi:hypothetical protein